MTAAARTPALPAARPLAFLGALVEMAKPRLSSLVVLTTVVGFLLGSSGGASLALLLWTAAGTSLCAFGANALNQWVECPWDLRMERTRQRPLPSGRVGARAGLAWGIGLVVAGGLLLAGLVNLLAAALAVAVAVLYVLAYTPLKRRSSLNTLVGAVCGAIPPLIGWAGAAGALAPAAGVLFGILFLWQIPHFLAIDWYHQDDYGRGGYCMLSRVDPSGSMTARQVVLYTLALFPVALLATPLGLGGVLYLAGALALTSGFLAAGVAFYRRRTRRAARRVFVVSLAYLPLLLLLLALDPTRAPF